MLEIYKESNIFNRFYKHIAQYIKTYKIFIEYYDF